MIKSAGVLLVVLTFFHTLNLGAAQVVTSQNGLTFIQGEKQIWNPSVVTGDIGFLTATSSSINSNYYYGTRGWIGAVVNGSSPNDQSSLITIQTAATALMYNNIVLNETTGQTGYGWFTLQLDESLWRFETANPNNTVTMYYQRIANDNRQFRGLLYEPSQNLLWILCDSDVIWVDPRQPIDNYTTPLANPNNGIVQNIASGNPSFRTILLDPNANMVYLAGTAIVYRTPATNNAWTGQFRKLDLESKTIGAGTYYTGVINSALNKMYLGSSLGIGVEVDIPTFSLRRIFFAPNEIFLTVFFDVANQVTFWSTDKASIVRVNTADFQIFAKITVTGTSNLKAVVQDPINQILHYGADFGLNKETFMVHQTNCTPYNCRDCFTVDTQYCGVCQKTGICSVAHDCPNDSDIEWQQNGFCPELLSVSPTSANTAGGTIVTVQGTYFQTDNNTKCFVTTQPNVTDFTDGSTRIVFDPLAVLSTEVHCQLPALPGVTNETVNVAVGVLWYTRVWGTPVPFIYYNCALMSCSDCFSTTAGLPNYPECGWCAGAFSCSANSTCTGSGTVFQTTGCPAVSATSIQTGSVYGSQSVTVSMSSFPQSLAGSNTWWCQFGSLTPVPGTVGSSAVTCTTPDATSLLVSGSTVDVAVSIQVGPSAASTQLFTPITKIFTYYDCNSFQTCDLCKASNYSSCTWCSTNLTCTFSSGPGAQAGCTGSNPCWTLLSTGVTPNSVLFGGSYTPVNISLSGQNYENIPINCQFQPIAGGAIVTTSAYYGNSQLITCTTPASGSISAAEYYVWVASTSDIRLTPKGSILFYSCSITSCTDCLDPRRTGCTWCNAASGISCSQNGACTGDKFTTQGLCPTATSAIPNNDALEGNNTISLNGNLKFPSVADLSTLDMGCQFLPPAGYDNSYIVTTPALAVDNGSSQYLQCSTPTVNVSGTWTLQAVLDSVPYSTATNFDFYNCSTKTTCKSCYDYQLCSWCATKCVATVACSSERRIPPPDAQGDHCPTITDITPVDTSADGGDVITVVGGPFVPPGSSTYTCLFGNVVTAGSRQGTESLECSTPRSSTGPSSITVLFDAVQYVNNTGTVNFFTCPVVTGTTCSSSCSTTNCGWCVTSSDCTSRAQCADLWVDKCLEPELLQTSASINGNESIPIRFDAAVSAFPVVSPADISCDFGTDSSTTKMVFSDPTDNSTIIWCYSPAVKGPNTVQLTVSYRGTALLHSPFTFVDCTTYTDCHECASASNCGWCLDTNLCSTHRSCAGGNWTETCPSILAVSPDYAQPDQPTEVTITASGITDNPHLAVYLGGQEISITSITVNSSFTDYRGEVKFTAPGTPDKKPANVSLEIRYDNETYTPVFQYKYLNPNIDYGALGGGLAAGLVVLGAIGGFAFWKLRQKYRGAVKVVVKEPDYAVVAWGNDVELRFRVPEDGYKKLETSLSRSDFALQLAVQAECPPTEQEAVAKSLVHVAHPSGKAVDLINCLVKVEVASCIQENTIFRGNSLVSKMFKFYSRVVGIRYLFRSMARVIAELETLGLKDARKKEKGQKGDGNSLLSVTMELDPNKMESMEALDADTNLLQLQLTCQKIFAVILKSGTQGFPVEFRRIFVEIDGQMMGKFGSDQAAFKAIGGFFFLRFVCPAITAPHVYGLLENPPNVLTQRQLVLISKVIQSVANMAVPGKKEKYMEALSGFIESGIPKMTKFYEEIRKPQRMDEPIVDMPTPKEVKLNALSALWAFIYQNQDKVKTACGNLGLGRTLEDEIVGTIEELVYEYKTAPKKLDATKKKKKKKSKAVAEAPDV